MVITSIEKTKSGSEVTIDRENLIQIISKELESVLSAMRTTIIMPKTTTASTTSTTTATSQESDDDYYGYKEYDYASYYDDSYYDEDIDCSIYGNAIKEIEDIEKKKCSEFGADGFRCVPFYACKGGEIITNGKG